MGKTWTEYDVVDQEGQSTHKRPWMLDSESEAVDYARSLLRGANNPKASYTVIEKTCREVETVGPSGEGERDDA